MLFGSAPQSLDPALDYSYQGFEINWLVYTGLTTYAHRSGLAGTEVIPGLATALPRISDGGRTYTATLRKGLRFSNGAPVVASDFTYAVERALSIPWGGAGEFIAPVIKGAAAYAAHKAKTISGISTDNATGRIVIHLTAPYGPFDNVLGFPALGPIPAGSPMKVEASSPPPGVGPYMVKNVNPNVAFQIVKNPFYDAHPIPGIPTGSLNYQAKINANVEANALAVLSNRADIFDFGDTVPGSLLSKIHSQAGNRFSMVETGNATSYIFLNAHRPPFNSLDAREAVEVGLNEPAFNHLDSDALTPGCFFLSPNVPGYSTGKCPYGNPNGGGNLAKAKQLVKASGQANVPITVYSEEGPPFAAWMTYYTSYLQQIGFKHVSLKLINDGNYLSVIGQSRTLDPQTGYNNWLEDFPNPVDYYGVLLDGDAISQTNNENFSMANDPHINGQVAKLGPVPTTALSTVAKQWQALDYYVAQKAYVVVFGYQKFPFFSSSRIQRRSSMINDIYGWDLTQLGLR
ncbi:MAG: ABC transporter substrate-binding protein [Solirubrobacteraceae bacterium]